MRRTLNDSNVAEYGTKLSTLWKVLAIASTLGVILALSTRAEAQAPTTRATPCDAATPTNAVCITWTHNGKDSSGATLTKPVTFRVTQRLGTGGTFGNIATALAASQLYVRNLAPGTYYFQVYANCSPDCTESAGSNTASGVATNPTTEPSAPFITVAVVIGTNVTPIYRILGKPSSGYYTTPAMYGLVPVGRACTGPQLFSYRGKAFRRVSVAPSEAWGTTADLSNMAAACTANI